MGAGGATGFGSQSDQMTLGMGWLDEQLDGSVNGLFVGARGTCTILIVTRTNEDIGGER